MTFYTVYHWEANSWDKDDEIKAKEKYVPLIMSLGAISIKMIRTDEFKFMVITEWPNAEKGKEAAMKIAEIREQAAEEFENTMVSSHAGEVFASN